MKKKRLPEASGAHVHERTRAHGVHEDKQRLWPLQRSCRRNERKGSQQGEEGEEEEDEKLEQGT